MSEAKVEPRSFGERKASQSQGGRQPIGCAARSILPSRKAQQSRMSRAKVEERSFGERTNPPPPKSPEAPSSPAEKPTVWDEQGKGGAEGLQDQGGRHSPPKPHRPQQESTDEEGKGGAETLLAPSQHPLGTPGVPSPIIPRRTGTETGPRWL